MMDSHRNRTDPTSSAETALAERAPKPSAEFRRRAWAIFQAALDRYLLRKQRR